VIATSFDEENAVLDPPAGMTNDQCESLSVWRGRLEKSGLPAVVSCWKITDKEWEQMRQTGRIWVMVLGETMPPLIPLGKNPFTNDPDENS
jgi:hypothetical protein